MTRTPTTRASLLLRLRDPADHLAWTEFVDLYEPVVYRLLRRRGLQDADAREVMQDLFLIVSQNVERWDPSRERGSFRGWLRRVTRNLVINWLKRKGRGVMALGVGGDEAQAFLASVPAASEPETVEFDLEVRRSLFQRAADQVRGQVQLPTWQAFWETAVAGRPPADVARQLGMSVGAIRVARCRVLARLQAIVREWESAT